MYRPLPQFLTIKNSEIQGLGLFATDLIKSNLVIGVAHVKDDRFENGWIRTPLGGFFNHSDNPNCEAVQLGDLIFLKTLKDIKKGEELTAKYWLYNIL